MKCKFLPLLTVIALLLTGCGSTVSSIEAPSAAETAPPAFGEESLDAAPSAAVSDTAEPSPSQAAEPAGLLEENEGVETVDFLSLAVKSLACCICLDGMTYNGSDPVFFWRAVGYFVALTGNYVDLAEDDGDTFLVQASDLSTFVEALFGPYPDQYPSLGEENPFVAWEFSEAGECYRVTKWDLSDYAAACGELEIQDGGFSTRAVFSERGEDVAAYDVTLSESGSEPFSFSIVGISAE